MTRHPAAVIGLVFTILLGILQQVAGSGLVNGNGLVLINDVSALIPLLSGLLIHQLVTPVAAPVLPIGTPVTTPSGATAVVAGPTAPTS